MCVQSIIGATEKRWSKMFILLVFFYTRAALVSNWATEEFCVSELRYIRFSRIMSARIGF